MWPNLMCRSEEDDVPLVAPQPVSKYNTEVHSMAKRDEAVPISMLLTKLKCVQYCCLSIKLCIFFPFHILFCCYFITH